MRNMYDFLYGRVSPFSINIKWFMQINYPPLCNPHSWACQCQSAVFLMALHQIEPVVEIMTTKALGSLAPIMELLDDQRQRCCPSSERAQSVLAFCPDDMDATGVWDLVVLWQ